MPEVRTHGSERVIAMSDAVVAIAMTLLVLPLVELAPEIDRHSVGEIVGDHRDVFIGFVLSFLVVYVFWVAHEAVFESVTRLSSGLRGLNMLWLLGVAFLPFPTALVGRHATTSSAPLYIGTMWALSALTAAMGEVSRRLRPGEVGRRSVPRVLFAWATTAVFALCTGVSALAPDLGLFGLLLIVVVRVAGVAVPTLRRAADTDDAPAS